MPSLVSLGAPTSSQRPLTIQRRQVWLRFCTLFNALLLAFLWWLENSRGETSNLTALLLYMPQHPFVIPTALLLIASLWRRSYFYFACNFWVLCAWTFSFGGFQVPSPQWPSSRPTVRIVTWNIRGWQLGKQEAPRQLRELNPDIICLEEAGIPDPRTGTTVPNSNPEKAWETQFPGWHRAEAGGVVTLSRFPLLSSRIQIVPGSFGRQLLVSRWQTPRGPLTVVTVHVSTATAPGFPPNNEYNQPRRLNEIIRHTHATAEIRAEQWPDIEDSVAGVTDPFVVAGDFNNPPRGILYHRLAQNWNDGFTQKGWGSGFTFPNPHPLMRLDYLWLSPSIQARQCFSPPTNASDHCPVVADISF